MAAAAAAAAAAPPAEHHHLPGVRAEASIPAHSVVARRSNHGSRWSLMSSSLARSRGGDGAGRNRSGGSSSSSGSSRSRRNSSSSNGNRLGGVGSGQSSSSSAPSSSSGRRRGQFFSRSRGRLRSPDEGSALRRSTASSSGGVGSSSSANSSRSRSPFARSAGSSSGIESWRGSSRSHASLRLGATHVSQGGTREVVSDAEVGEHQGGAGVPGRSGQRRDVSFNHERRYSGLLLSLVEPNVPTTGRSAEARLEVSVAVSGAMLPGVEVARRRRGRISDAYEGGYGGGHESGHGSRSLRTGITVAHHHHHFHHHHHHHVHHQSARNPSRPGTPRPGSLVRRVQDILHEHRARSPFHQVSSITDRGSAVDGSTTAHASHRRSHGHRSGDTESRSSTFSSLWRRSSSETSSSLRGAALEARNRLDERLRAAAHTNPSRQRSWQAVQSSYDMSLLFSDEDEGDIWSDDDGWETSLHEWLAAWAPSAAEERWSRNETSSSGRASSSRNPAFRPRPSEGLSKAAINALPRQVMGSSRAQGSGNWSKMEQEDCPVCLEGFVVGQSLMALPCSHRFHPECLTPWLTNHGQCPYCRAEIVKDADNSREQKGTNSIIGGSDEELISWVETIERGVDRLSYS